MFRSRRNSKVRVEFMMMNRSGKNFREYYTGEKNRKYHDGHPKIKDVT